jgi:hypothetical protein
MTGWRWLAAAAGLFGLNLCLTLQDVWPTPAVQWAGEVSVEIAAVLAVLAALRVWRGRVPQAGSATAAVLVLLTLCRYAAITAPALYGRPINLYWDAPHFGNVLGMLTRVAPWWALCAGLLGLVLLLWAMWWLLRLCLRAVLVPLQSVQAARVVLVLALLVVAGYGLQRWRLPGPETPPYAEPVLTNWVTQARALARGWWGDDAALQLPASPPLRSGLQALDGADVLVTFIESYGASTVDRPQFRSALAPARQHLQQAVTATGRQVVSTYVTSPTFGGNSWLAHITLLSGIRVDEPGRYAALMTRDRRTLGTAFQDRGYRSVAVMPGLRLAWPEGSFYHFDAIHDAPALAYQGPPFGWFVIPDQYTLAWFTAHELQPRPRQSVFAVFPTLGTHLPFRPTPPYQPQWSRMFTATPYDEAPLRESLAETPQWLDLGASYVVAVDSALTMLGGWLHEHPDPALVLVLLGDHQPASSVTGEGASWDVPVHVITGNQRVLAALRKAGFGDGLEPARTPLSGMEQLSTVLLAAFDAP